MCANNSQISGSFLLYCIHGFDILVIGKAEYTEMHSELKIHVNIESSEYLKMHF